MSELIATFWDLVPFGAVQNLPLLALALIVDRLFVRWSWTGPRGVVWLVVTLELLLPPSFGSPLHVVGSRPVEVGFAGMAASTLPFWLFVVWAIGAVVAAVLPILAAGRARRRLLAGSAAPSDELRRLAARCADRLGLRTLPTVRVHAGLAGACVLGVRRPVVLLGAPLLGELDRGGLEHVLLHELGHVRRRDPLRGLLWRQLLAAWWFHPTAWIAPRRLALLRELRCDALVTTVLGGRARYCRTLAERALATAPDRLPAPALVRQPAEMVQRVAALRAPESADLRRGVGALAAALLLLLCCVPLRDAASRLAALPVALPFGAASLDQMPGCLTRRYFVLGRLHDPAAVDDLVHGTSRSPDSRPQSR